MSSKCKIGTSGWNYKQWRGIFYPPKIPVSGWLDFYTRHFDTVEVNATFYRLPKPETFDNWYEKTPRGFLWSVKASKYITHTKRLQDCREPLERLYNAAGRLKEKLGPILLQLPPNMVFEREIFIPFCENLDPSFQHVLEVRHQSWIDPCVFKILSEHNIAFCLSDTAGKYPYHEEITADFVYVRLHGSQKLYASEYSEDELQEWGRKIRNLNMQAYVYFDNDFKGFAIKNAKRLKEILAIP
ncbi:MAG: DUF72 domain-containing protein [Desulfobacteraceae bacterium]|nr:DUF72 domain-containing protein [Desulfobacteraceae bacterium]